MKSKFCSATEVAKLIRNDSTICTVGMTLISASESILKAIEKSFLETGEPKNLTLMHSAGQGDRKRGILHLAHEGLVTKIYGSHWGLQPLWMDLIAQNKVLCYCIPQGQITHLYRAMSSGLPGRISKVGLGTFVDPRLEGGKMNEKTMMASDYSKIVEFEGEEYIFYPAIPIDYCVIRGTVADENGNLTTEEEAMKLEVLPAVLATKRYGGKVIAQVKRVAKKGTLNPKDVTVPGVFIDKIVVCDNPLEDHRQTSSWYFDPAYSGQLRVPEIEESNSMPLNIRKLIGRRAVMELDVGDIINLGTGIPNDVVGQIVKEEDISDFVTITVESGIYNGVQAGGIDFGIGKNTDAMITHHEQMDFYNGTGVDVAFLGAGELDQYGNVNSTKMGARCPGAGGLLDITSRAKKIVFCATFMSKELEVSFEDGKLKIVKEGKIKKLVQKVRQISTNAKIATETGQKILFVTERAVFEVKKDGVHLIEIAPGVRLKEDILDCMDFMPIVEKDLKIMSADLFGESKFNLKEKMMNKIKSNL